MPYPDYLAPCGPRLVREMGMDDMDISAHAALPVVHVVTVLSNGFEPEGAFGLRKVFSNPVEARTVLQCPVSYFHYGCAESIALALVLASVATEVLELRFVLINVL
jgi:hypothetical protein